ncbi:non-homologous end-joining DNA ligase [Limnochorda pilosa]|uniref:DNA ligase (ATP) n=1 Tax=Limnochorda pilosa TaxID=1555112 RepID=A0A0K2SML1_LIMPI|nr:non-homologous end-joining DNA ligase [Limnochorda pilosa]BAS28345.1 ATP-dependent DNA ligase [Limnochorda pilosa]
MGALPLLRPMLASPGEPLSSPDYLYEVKWDGFRCLAYLEEGTRLLSRRGHLLNEAFPELAGLDRWLPQGQPLILDGELVVLEGARPAIHALQERLARHGPVPGAPPASLVVFDLLYLKGRPQMDRPLEERRRALEELLAQVAARAPVHLSAPLPAAGRRLLEAASARGLEGVMAKRLASPYRPGRRSPDWLKIRRRPGLEAAVVGYTQQAGEVRSLAIARPQGDGWRYAGHVASGLSPRLGRQLLPLLERWRTPRAPVPLPLPRGAHFGPPPEVGTLWVTPRLVVEVEYLEVTSAGLLRHPSLKGLRPDKAPEELRDDRG